MAETWLCQRVEEIAEQVSLLTLTLDRLGIRAGRDAKFIGGNWEISTQQIAQWVPGTTLPLGDSSEYVRFKDGNLEIRGGAFSIHTGETGAHMVMDGSSLLGYNASEDLTIKLDWAAGTLWAKKGGFGGTEANPVIVLDDVSAKVFVPTPIYLGEDDSGLVVGGSDSGVRYIASNNFSAGSAGWQIRNDGDAEFNTVTLRGDLITDYVTVDDSGITIETGTTEDETGRTLRFLLDDVEISRVSSWHNVGTGYTTIKLETSDYDHDNMTVVRAASTENDIAYLTLDTYSGETCHTRFALSSDADDVSGNTTFIMMEAKRYFSSFLGGDGYAAWWNPVTEVYVATLYPTGNFTHTGTLITGGGTITLNGADNSNKTFKMQDYTNDSYTTMYASADAFHFELPAKGHSQMRVYSKQDTATDAIFWLESDYSTAWYNCFNVLADGTTQYKGNLQAYRNAAYTTGYIFVPLTTPLTSTSWDGDSKGTGDDGTIDLSAVFSAPAGIKAVLIRRRMLDGTVGAEWTAGPSNTSVAATIRTIVTAVYVEENAVVPCDANGDIYCTFSTTLTECTLQIHGYWI